MTFSLLKFYHLVTHKSPVIGEFKEYEKYSKPDDAIDFSNTKIAFTVRNFITKEAKYDPRYVEWLVAIYEGSGGNDKIT